MIAGIEIVAKHISKNRMINIRCPFHEEKTPSGQITFTNDLTRGKFNCLSCGKKGTVESMDAFMYREFNHPSFSIEIRTEEHEREL